MSKLHVKKGDTVIIPEQFNGYDVNKIDLHLFTRDDFSNVVINTKNFILTNEYGIKDINSTLKISICKEKYDYFKDL